MRKPLLLVPLLVGVMALGSPPRDSKLLLFVTCSTCVQPCVYGDPSSHETIGPTGNRIGGPEPCNNQSDCGTHYECGGETDNDLINGVYLASEAGDANGLRTALWKLGDKVHINHVRGVLQFEGCRGIIGAQLPLSREMLRFAESALSD